jgi:hypothetical protein
MKKKGRKKEGDNSTLDPAFDAMSWELASNPSTTAHGNREVQLWRRVIIQTMFDFCSVAVSAESQNNKLIATKWLLHNTRDFFLVCHYADIDHKRLRLDMWEAAADSQKMLKIRMQLTKML